MVIEAVKMDAVHLGREHTVGVTTQIWPVGHLWSSCKYVEKTK